MGQIIFVFVHAQGIKTVHARGVGGSENGKILSTYLLNAPKSSTVTKGDSKTFDSSRKKVVNYDI